MTPATLSPDLAGRLAKVCGLLGSAHDGERASAALLADRLVRQSGLTWTDVLRPAALPPPMHPPTTTRSWEPPRDWRWQVEDCLTRPHLWTAWELGFLNSIGFQRGLSQKQRDVLNRLIDRLNAMGGPL